MSHDCDKVAAEIQFVFINSHEQGGDNSEELVTEAVCYLLFKRPVLCMCVYIQYIHMCGCVCLNVCVYVCVSCTRSPHKIMKAVGSISDDHFPSIV